MEVKIEYLSLMSDITKQQEDSVQIEDNSTVKHVIEKLVEKYGENLEKNIYTPSRKLSAYIIVVLNGKDIRTMEGLETKVNSGDELTFIPAIAGGA